LAILFCRRGRTTVKRYDRAGRPKGLHFAVGQTIASPRFIHPLARIMILQARFERLPPSHRLSPPASASVGFRAIGLPL
jgi:hypothetical protein